VKIVTIESNEEIFHVSASGKIRLGTMIRGGFSIHHLNYFEN